MLQDNLTKLYDLRKQLHNCPEASGKEVRTQEILKRFIRTNTSLEIMEKEKWFYCIYNSKKKEKPTIAFRADMDGVAAPDGSISHRCGHDGHSTVLAGLALELEKMLLNRDVVLIFQFGEETGQGAIECKLALNETEAEEIYGFHNIPGYPLGSLLLRTETFACASKGMTIKLIGKPSHAAYPEAGINPAYTIGELITNLPDMLEQSQYSGMVLCTIIKVTVGEEAFGVSASEGELLLTIRGQYEADLEKLQERLEQFVKSKSKKAGIQYQISYCEQFPETKNDSVCVEKVKRAGEHFGYQIIYPSDPFRWSEDFGHYLKETKGAFFGIGDGEEYAQLHTEGFEFPDEIIEKAVYVFKEICLQQ